MLQRALGSHGVGARAISTADGDYGQALISRWQLVNTEIHDLSFRRREPRRAISTDMVGPFGSMRIVATHLGLSLRERRSQINKLLAMLGGRDDPTLAMGDFNDWFWAGSVRRNLARVLPDCSRHRTFPAVLPLFALDGIYLWPSGLLVASRTDPEARTLSDHLPVIADIDLGRANA